MSVRLSTGFCHGMQLQDPSQATRPTASRVRTAVWNSLQEDLPGARVLDIFAGSGAVGIEALSRGATLAAFVEIDKAALKALQANLSEVKRRAKQQALTLDTQVIAVSAEIALAGLSKESFDIVWLDPPFAALEGLLPPLVRELGRVTHRGGWIVVESSEESLPFVAKVFEKQGEPWFLVKQKAYGKIGVSFFRNQPSPNEDYS